MRKIIRFSRFFVPAAIISAVLTVVCIVGFFVNDGFNLGLDFQAGLIQEVQIAPSALNFTWSGAGNATLSSSAVNMSVVISGVGVENRTHVFNFDDHRTIGALAQAMVSEIEGLNVELRSRPDINSQWLLRFGIQGDALLGSEIPFVVHYLQPGIAPISVAEVRDVMEAIEQGVTVQNVGQPSDRHFLIRVGDEEDGIVRAEHITRILETHFGAGQVLVLRSDFVSARFAQNLTDQIGFLLVATLLLILLYCTFRFKLQYAVGAVIAIVYDAIIIVGFVVWTRMEFNTATIAAILTILGYSTNDTIVVFDRIRENRRLFPDDPYVDVLNRSLTGTLNRTIITTFSTILAVLALFIFTTGSMRDFALALMVGMISGVFTTTFITSGFVYFWEKKKIERDKRKRGITAAASLEPRAASS